MMKRARRIAVAVLLASLVLTGCTADARQRVPVLQAETVRPVPAWAAKQRELLDLHVRVAEEFERAYMLPNGYFNFALVHGGGVAAPDDVFECIYKFPMLYALGAEEPTWRVWWKAWRASIEQCSEQDLFANEMCKYLDWHHNAEQYEGFWLAALCAPNDPEYRRQSLKFAGLYDGTNPDVPNYDPEHKVIRSILSGGAGPVLTATVAHWDERADPPSFWDNWLDCAHDGPVNLVTTCFGTNAYMLTGDERHRSHVLEYTNAWRDRARNNNGIIPSIVNLDGTVPQDWWGGVMGWNFTDFGGLFQVSIGPRAAWANALLLTGDTSYYDTMRTLADELWEQRSKNKDGNPDVPCHYGKDGWYNQLGRAGGVYASMLANIYLATMKDEDLERILQRPIQGMAGHAEYHEGGYEPNWIRYLVGRNPDWPEKSLQRSINRAAGDLKALQGEHDAAEKERTDIRQVGMCGPLVNQMTGGIMPLWHGQLHLARFRYFDPDRRRPGIPPDCAALVESMSDDSATLVLVNTSQTQSHTVLVQTGAYGEHQCLSVQPPGGKPVKVDGTLFSVDLAPRAQLRLVVKMKRYANTPTLELPWDTVGKSAAQ